MNTSGLDERLRDIYERNAPLVDEAEFADRLRDRTGSRRARPARGGAPHRALFFALVSVVVIAVVAVGAYEVITRAGQEEPVVVIGDDTMSAPSGNGSAAAIEGASLKYGQIVDIEGLRISVTVEPIVVPATEDDPIVPIDPSPVTVTRFRSQYIVTNVSNQPCTFIPGNLRMLDGDGDRIMPLDPDPMEIEPGATVTRRLDWLVFGDSIIPEAVVYSQTAGGDEAAVWGPEAITEGPGFPVLRELPELRAEDVVSIDTTIRDAQGGATSTLWAVNNEAGVEAVIDLYRQTTLVPSEGYPTHQTQVQVVLHMKDGNDFSIWLGSLPGDACIIQDTRAGGDGNPPAATGSNSALLRAFYLGESPETVTTSGVAPTLSSVPGGTSGAGWLMTGGPQEIGDLVDAISVWATANGVSGLPVYLPSAMPAGWAVARESSHLGGTGDTDNPAMWPAAGTGARSAGYGVTFTDGTRRLELQLNYPGDLGDVTWTDTGTQSLMGGTVKTYKTAGTVYVLIPTEDALPLYVWGDESLEAEAVSLAREVTQWAQL